MRRTFIYHLLYLIRSVWVLIVPKFVFPCPPSIPDTVGLGVDRAHVVATDATVFSPLLANATTSRAAASDATGFSPLLAKVTTCRAAASDATGLSPLLANLQFPTDAALEQRVKTND